MPYENMMPYMPIQQLRSLPEMRARAQDSRNQYEQNDIARIQSQFQDPGQRLQQEMQAITRHNQGRTFASSNPTWDAWFQALGEGTNGRGVIGGGRAARFEEQDMLEMAQNRPSGATPSVMALKGLSYNDQGDKGAFSPALNSDWINNPHMRPSTPQMTGTKEYTRPSYQGYANPAKKVGQ